MKCCCHRLRQLLQHIYRYDLLIKAIESVQAQTYNNIELIVVDDASDKSIKEKLIRLSEAENFKYIYIDKEDSKGGNHARNVGIQSGCGEYFAFLDDDDEWFPDKIEKQVSYQKTHSDCGVVACARMWEYDFDKAKTEELGKMMSGDLSTAILTRMPYTTSSLLVCKATLLEAGTFDEKLRFWQDYELIIRLCQITKVGVVPESLLLYRVIHQDKNRLTNNISGWQDAVNYIEQKHCELIENAPKCIQKQHQALIAKDGAKRASRVGDRRLCRQYLRKAFFNEPSLRNLVKYILNVSHVDP